VAPVLVSLGAVMLARAERTPSLRRVIAALAGLTVLVAAVRAGTTLPGLASRWNVAALPSVTGALGPVVILAAGVVAMAAFWLLDAAGRRAPMAVGGLALALVAPTTAYAVHIPVLRSQADVYPAGWVSPRAAVAGAAGVGYDVARFDHVAVKAYQWFLPHTRFEPFDGSRRASPEPLFFSGARLSGPVAGGCARAIWRDPGRDQALWRRCA
jgi:hypothetical protein